MWVCNVWLKCFFVLISKQFDRLKKQFQGFLLFSKSKYLPKRLKIHKGNVYSTFWIHGLYAFFTSLIMLIIHNKKARSQILRRQKQQIVIYL